MASLKSKVQYITKPKSVETFKDNEVKSIISSSRESMKPKLKERYNNVDLQRKAMGVKELIFPDKSILSTSIHKPRTENFNNNLRSNGIEKLSSS